MPKRVIDGEGLWKSDKLAKITPPKFRAEYANILPLALANGVFEANPSRVWSEVYSYNRPDVSRDHVAAILQQFESVGLLFRWTDESGKVWGYWTGSEKPGRLPSKSTRARYGVGPTPPDDLLNKYLQREPAALPPEPVTRATEPLTSKRALPADFGISDAVRQWAAENGYCDLEKHLVYFVGHAKARGYKYASWDQAFMNAIRENWAKLEQKPRSTGPTLLERTKAQLRGE